MTECYVNILHLKVDIPADNNNVYNIIIRIYYINYQFSFQNINTLTSDLHQVLRFILNILINEKVYKSVIFTCMYILAANLAAVRHWVRLGQIYLRQCIHHHHIPQQSISLVYGVKFNR